MRKDFSPEERLLRLIRGPKKKEAFQKQRPEGTAQHHHAAVSPKEASLGQARTGVRPSAARALSLRFKLAGLNTRAVNSALIVVLVCVLAYFVYDLFYSSYVSKEPDIFTESAKAEVATKKEKAADVQPYTFYSSPIQGRNVFKPQQIATKPIVNGPSVEEIIADLSLIGIIAGTRPQAIIEEKKSGKSYFLYKGGAIGKSKIVEILDDSVIMEYQGERFELVL